jgi:hypothetical protein
MLLAIDTRERRVVADMVAKSIGGGDPLPAPVVGFGAVSTGSGTS